MSAKPKKAIKSLLRCQVDDDGVVDEAEAQVPDGPLTPYALAMPEKHQIVDALYLVELPAHTVLDSGVAAYRAYYRNEKRGYRFTDKWVPAKWTRRQPPEWF